MKKIVWYPDKDTINANKQEYIGYQLVYYTPIEELLNAVSHGLGVVAAFVGLIVTMLNSTAPLHYLASLLMFAGFLGLFLNSTLYHAITKISVKKYLRIFDHATVNMLVLACGVVLCLCTSSHPFNYVTIGLSTAIIISSYILSLISLKKFKTLIFINNFIIGIMLVVVYIINRQYIPSNIAYWCLAGVITCIIGSILYSIKKPFMHTVFHIFVLLGPLCFLVAQSLYIAQIT